MKITNAHLKRIISEAISGADAHRLSDGIAKRIEPVIRDCASKLLDAMANAASKYDDDSEYGHYINEFDFRDNREALQHLLLNISETINDIADDIVERGIESEEDMFSNGDTFQTNAFMKARARRDAFINAKRARPTMS